MKRSGIVRICSVLSIAIFFLTQGKSQDSAALAKYYPKQRISRIEFLIGPSLSFLRGDNQQYKKYGTTKLAYSIGLGLSQRFSHHFELQGRVLWERKGYNETSPFFSSNIDQDYITLSIVPQFLFGKMSQFNAGLGPYLGALQQVVTFERYFNPPLSKHFNSLNGYEKFDFGFTMSIGYSFSHKNFSFRFQLIDCYGLRQIWTWNQNNSLFPPTYNSTYSFLIGVSNRKSKNSNVK